jgi:Arc/MetJ-type ribon-helix-helix transcriptional regulator
MEQEDSIPVPIPSSVYKKLEEKIKDTKFASVTSYITFLLRETLAETEKRETPVLSKKDEDKVKERLRALGYIE